MSVTEHRVLAGRYCDSLVLMQLHAVLEALAGVEEAAAVMATEANREILEARSLWPQGGRMRPHDLLVVVRAADAAAAAAALDRVDELLHRRDEATATEYRYRGLATALRERPDARWVAVSVPGEHAAAVADEALDAGRHVFLYSDNVPVEREVELKRKAATKGLLVLGPDCGTARIGGVGLGFANRVRRGCIGLVGASGTGLQAVSCRIDELARRGEEAAGGEAGARVGGAPAPVHSEDRGKIGEGRIGVSQVIGTGGRDLSQRVEASATLQALDLLARDPDTEVIVLVSKPPAPEVAARVIETAGRLGKPVVICLIGAGASADVAAGGDSASPEVHVHLVQGLERAAELAVEVAGLRKWTFGDASGSRVVGIAGESPRAPREPVAGSSGDGPVGDRASFGEVDPRRSGVAVGMEQSVPAAGGHLRGLFSGGTLALEAAVALRDRLDLTTNLGLAGTRPLADPEHLAGHSIVDLGADELTRGRPHPMIDPSDRDRRLRCEAADPSVGVIVVDVVLGDGAHPDPAAGLAPAIADARREAAVGGRDLEVIVLLVGAQADPQDPANQADRLRQAGAFVTRSLGELVARIATGTSRSPESPGSGASTAISADGSGAVDAGAVEGAVVDADARSPIPLDALDPPVVVNVGLDHFADAVAAQDAKVVRVDWRPPAGGDARLTAVLDKMKRPH